MASYTIRFDGDLRLTRVVVEGEIVKEEGEEIITRSRTAALEHDSDILYDVRAAVSNVSLADWFFLPRRLGALQDTEARRSKVAVVVSSKEQADYKFYEDVARNAGLKLRVFLTEEEGIAWLKATAD